MKCDVCIVGAGPAGATAARMLAERGYRCLIVEIRNHIGGNLHDAYNRHGILMHSYGPHFFRTDSDDMWKFLSQYTAWHPYQHKVLSNVQGQLVPFPVNLDTYNMLHNSTLTSEEFAERLKQFHIYENPKNAEEAAINQIGEYMYELFIKNYTAKQWGTDPRTLDPEIMRRIRVRTDREDRYQPLKYQALPKDGYTRMFERILDHPNIHLLLNSNYKDVIKHIKYKKLIYTAQLDYFFDFSEGELDYRSLRLEEKTFFQEEYQTAAVVNYPNNFDFTRITEYKKMTGQRHHFTTVHFEYPIPYVRGKTTPYYPILNDRNLALREKYLDMAGKLEDVYFLGRLAEYRYYDMDQIFSGAIELVNSNFEKQ